MFSVILFNGTETFTKSFEPFPKLVVTDLKELREGLKNYTLKRLVNRRLRIRKFKYDIILTMANLRL